ncbi:copper chaperone PCu(A)C [Microvirga sp. VF16]|uniref:copper chaperone PCu(A)C n=1 Tax=Microvirga sp. VF16 TaxID=2807101 RepID=UPI00193DE063|nr:copper chaperone PCu(A)C [Microvirga sp. VF16]QRM35276.1 copper chaperone PCu(A)C [Microvirga sp. VF16]
MKSVLLGTQALLVILLGSNLAPALGQGSETYRTGTIIVEAPWSRATPGGAKVAAGYMRITNTGSEPDRLVGGSTVVAERFEVHRSTVTDGIARMEPVAGGLEIAPGRTEELKPGGSLHAMFVNLRQGLKPGDTVKGTLMFEKAGTVGIEYRVGGIGAQAAPAAASAHQNH